MITTRQYTNLPGITPDYHLVRKFLMELGYSEFIYARWDWMITHGYLDHSGLASIKLWEDDGHLVGLATYDTRLGTAYCLTKTEYQYLKKEMLLYAQNHLNDQNTFHIVIPDEDRAFQDIAYALGYTATPEAEHDAIYYIDENKDITISLPEGYSLISMEERYDPYEYRRVLWKGFNHELDGEGPLIFNEQEKLDVDFEMLRDNVDLSLKLAVVSPDNHFVSYCGMWYDTATDYALIEPVATDPDYRGKGLAQAAVLEGIRRVKNMGAKRVFVGSNQQFYYSIGLFPYKKSTMWKKQKLW